MRLSKPSVACRRATVIATAMAAWALASSDALGQPEREAAEGPPELVPTPPRISFRVNPRLWWASPSGKVKLPAGAAGSGVAAGESIRLEALNLDTPEFSPAGEADVRVGRLRFSFYGSAYSRDADMVADAPFRLGGMDVSAGEALNTSFDFNLFEVAGGYRFLSYDFARQSTDREVSTDIRIDTYAVLGLRMIEIDIAAERPGPGDERAGIDEFFFQPFAGVRGEVGFGRDFGIELQFDVGGYADSDRSSGSLGIMVNYFWRPVENIAAQVGWRQVIYTFSDGEGPAEFSYSGAIAGLFAGVVIRF